MGEVRPALDLLQEKGAIDTLFLTKFTWANMGRQIPASPFRPRFKETSSERLFGGNYATPSREFYKETTEADARSTDTENSTSH